MATASTFELKLTWDENAASFSARVRRRLRQSLGNENLRLDAIAAAMSITPATLQRRLRREGVSYRVIRQQLRRDLAIIYLADPDRSTTEISWDLGYSERSAFVRAFRKWTGIAPGRFRRRS